MAIIYQLRYWTGDGPVDQSFKYEQDARFNYDKLLERDDVDGIELYRQRTMRPSLNTMLRILNGEPYIYEEKMIATTGSNQKGPSA